MSWKTIEKFTGFATKPDPSKIDDGQSPQGQNVVFFDGDRIATRNLGYENFGDLSAWGTTDPIQSCHVFRKRDGTNIPIVSFGQYLCYFHPDAQKFALLKSGYTLAQSFGFADYNINTDVHSYCYFGNATENFSRWNGAYAVVSAVSNEVGMVSENSVFPHGNNGANYTVNDVVTITGGAGAGCTLKILTLGNGAIGTYTLNNAGNYYLIGDVLTVTPMVGTPDPIYGQYATFQVTSVNVDHSGFGRPGSGQITGLSIINNGQGYVANGTYFLTGGNGNGNTKITVNTITSSVNTFQLLTSGSGYVAGTDYATTGGTGTGFTVDIANVVSNTITIQGTENLGDKGFSDTSNMNVDINGVTYNYSGGLTTTTLIGISPDPVAAGIQAGDIITQTVEEFSENPMGNIYMVANNRLFISGISLTPQAIYFSQYGDATVFTDADLVTNDTATSPGIFNLGEGGGAVTDLKQDESSLYFLKNSLLYSAQLSDSFYSLGILKPFDGKSQTIGCAYPGASFSGDNYIYLFTPDNKILQLGRYEDVNYPQTENIADIITPTISGTNFNNAKGIVYNNYSYFTMKADNNVSYNNLVLIWDTVNNIWLMPLTGWPVNDFFVYNDELYFISSNSTNVYHVIGYPQDEIYDVNAQWYSKQFTFDDPNEQKIINNFYIEGYISDNTTITMEALFDENGVTATKTTNFSSSEVDYIYGYSSSIPQYNTFGFNPFGEQQFGSNPSQTNNKKFRMYLNKELRDIPFYNLQIAFSSSGANQQWAITRIGFDVEKYEEPLLRKIMRAFKIL